MNSIVADVQLVQFRHVAVAKRKQLIIRYLQLFKIFYIMEFKLFDGILANDEFVQRAERKLRNLLEFVHFKMQLFKALQPIDRLVKIFEIITV